MPLYDIRCPKCLTVETNVVQASDAAQPQCSHCFEPGNTMERVWLKGPPVHEFQEGFYEHAADPDGNVPYFSSRQKYKSYLREMGMYADYVEGR